MDLIRRNIKLSPEQSRKFADGNILQLTVKYNNELITTFFHKEFSFRIQENNLKTVRIVKDLSEQIKAKKNLLTEGNFTKIKRVLELDEGIKSSITTSSKDTKKSTKDEFGDLEDKIGKRSGEIEKIERKLGLVFLRNDKIPYCENCYSYRRGQTLVKAGTITLSLTQTPICSICNNQMLKNKRIRYLPGTVSHYLLGGWLEDYIANLLERLGWSTWTSIYIVGASGVSFEIDILAIKNGYMMIGECKSGKIKQEHLTNFLSKFNEIRSHYAFFFSLASVEKTMETMVEKNPAFHLIQGNLNDNKILKELQKFKTN